jgi:Zn-dependent alcohol dehydrogenase
VPLRSSTSSWTGKYQLKELVSRRLPLAELNHAFDRMRQGE